MRKGLTNKQVNTNIKKVYVYSAIAGLMLWTTVYAVFMLSKGLSYTQISIVEAVFAAAVMLEIVGGAFADIVGRKVAVLLKSIVIACAAALFGLANSVWIFFLSNIIWGIGLALGAGAETALLYDSLKSVGREKEFLKIYGNCRVFGFVAGMFGALAGAYLYTLHVQLPFFVGAAAYGLSGIVFFSAYETPALHCYSIKRHYLQIKDGAKYALKHPNIRWIALLGMMSTMYFAFFGVIQSPYFLSIGFSMQDVGWIVALSMAVDALFTYNTERIHRKFGEKICFVLIMATCAVSSIGLGLLTGVPAIAFLFVQKFGSGFGMTFAEHYLQKHSQSKIRATVSSAEGFMNDFAMALSLPFLGLLVDAVSIKLSLIIIGIGLFVFGSILIAMFPAHKHKVVW